MINGRRSEANTYLPTAIYIFKHTSIFSPNNFLMTTFFLLANCADAELSIYDGYSSFTFNPEIMKKFCGDLKYYKNVEERTEMSKRNRLLIRYVYYGS